MQYTIRRISRLAFALGALPFLSACLGLRLTVAPTVDTSANVGVEARVSGEVDFFVVHAGGGGGGGWVNGQAASAWHVVAGGSIPLPRKDDRNWLDLDLYYSGYFLHAVQAATPDATPYAHGVRLSAAYRRMVANQGDELRFFIGAGFFGEAIFREGMTLGIFGLPIGIQLLAAPKIKRYF